MSRQDPSRQDPVAARAVAGGRAHRYLVAATVGALVVLAYLNRFIQDDAFISFRYADHLARGLGLVWNPGEAVEGYTNFLWTLLMALPHAVGWEPVAFAQAVGLALFALSLGLTYLLALRLLGSLWPAWAVVIVAGTQYTFNAYATGGLETQLQACLFVASTLLTIDLVSSERASPVAAAALSLLFGLALLTRLDSAVVVAVLGAVVGWRLLRGRRPGEPTGRLLAALVLPGLFIVGPWFVWKLGFYGSLLPNTFHAKTGESGAAVQGARFVWLFWWSYGYVWLVAVAAVFARRLWGQARALDGLLAALVIAWTGYVISVGGDFMEFRFMVPVIPLLAILFVRTIWAVTDSQTLRGLLVLLLVAASVRHGIFFTRTDGVAEIRRLNAYIRHPARDWKGVGERLGRLFDRGDLFDRDECGVTIATTAAGAIPYYSRLETIDMLGLNDARVAREGRIFGDRIGHQRMASLDYLLEREVSLVIGNPWVVPLESTAHREQAQVFVTAFASGGAEMPPTARFLEIPVNEGHKITVLSLTPDGCVARAADEGGWVSFPVPPASSLPGS